MYLSRGPAVLLFQQAPTRKLEVEMGSSEQSIQLLAPKCTREWKGKEGRHMSGTWHVVGAISKRGLGVMQGSPGGQKYVSMLASQACHAAGDAPRCKLPAGLSRQAGTQWAAVVWWPEEQKVFSGCFVLSLGHEVHQTIYMINSEKEAFGFAFRESSLFSEGCNASVKIEPMEGSIAPLSR